MVARRLYNLFKKFMHFKDPQTDNRNKKFQNPNLKTQNKSQIQNSKQEKQ
jgi:hypothetical protein